MKTATLTWFLGNYGSALQAYALQQVLLKNGYENEIIDYRPNTREKARFFLSSSARFVTLKSKVNSKLVESKYVDDNEKKEKERRYDDFYRKFRFSKRYYEQGELMEIADMYDVYICGSDQIWNPAYFKDCNYLTFANKDKIKVSYAPSIGTSEISPKVQNRMKHLLHEFNSISIREETGRKLIQPLVEKDVDVVCDPVLLLERDMWEREITTLNKNKMNRYILCYFLGQNELYTKVADTLASRFNLEIRSICTSYWSYKNCKNPEKAVGPVEWLQLIADAEIVLTDSFHATAFSLMFNKNFFVMKRFSDSGKKSQNSRITDLLKKVELSSRTVDLYDILKANEYTIDNEVWNTVNVALEKFRNSSTRWLLEALK